MEQDREEQIRRRAYEIWEGGGRPEGSHEAHWQQAERELEDEQTGTAGTSEESGEAQGVAASADSDADAPPTSPGQAADPSPAGMRPPSGSERRGG